MVNSNKNLATCTALFLVSGGEHRSPARLACRLQREARRVLGLIILRGDEVVDLVIEGPPPADETRAAKSQQAPGGPGMGRAAGRGMPVAAPGAAPAGLAGVAPGVGAPAPGQMMPRPSMAAPPVMHPPGMPPPGMPPPGFRWASLWGRAEACKLLLLR